MTSMEFAPPWAAHRCLQFSAGERPGGRHHGGHRGHGGGYGRHGGPGRFGGRRRRGDVRVALLLLLAEEPRNGYQLMQAIEERTAGRWTPSPGSVYPALAQLEDEGLIRTIEHDGGKRFELTDAGREHVAGLGEERAPWEPEDDAQGDSRRELWSLIPELVMAVKQVQRAADDRQIDRARTLLSETRRRLYGILADEPEGDAPAGDERATEQ